MAATSMSSLKTRLQDSAYINWVKAGLCIIHTKEGLEEFAGNESNELHRIVLTNPNLTSIPTNPGHSLSRSCIHITRSQPRIVCSDVYCQNFVTAVIQESINPKYCHLANTDVAKWRSQPWEMAKLFMNPGQQPGQTSPCQTDLSGIINFISHCRVPKNHIYDPSLLDKVRNARNDVMHTSNMKLSASEYNIHTQAMIDLLGDPSMKKFQSAQLALTEIQKILGATDFQVTLEDESKVIDKLAKELQTLVLGIKADIATGAECAQEERHTLRQQLETEIIKVSSSYGMLQKKVDESSDLHETTRRTLTNFRKHLETTKTEISNLKTRVGTLERDVRSLQEVQEIDKEGIHNVKQQLEVYISNVTGVISSMQKQQEVNTENINTVTGDISSMQKQQEVHTKQISSLERQKAQTEQIPSDEDKSRLQQYLKDGYKGKLDVTLLPDWEQLHVTEIFTPSIFVCDEAKQNQEEEKYRKLGTFRDLFYKDDVLQKRVVLLGEAGAGKTTFSKHLTSVWCESSTLPQFTDVSVLEQFHYFFYVSCRFAKKEESILDMIANQLFDDEKMLKVAIHVLKNHPEDCFILIDGADEWEGSPTSATGRRGDKAGLPDMTGVVDSVILITSRPWRFYALSKKTQDIFMRLKINGIKDIGELSYHILEQLEDPDPRQSSSEFLDQVIEKDMYELMKIPLILLIALRSWVDDHSLHKSMCINYINMLQTFIRRSKGQANWPSSENILHLIPDLNDLEVKWEQQLNELPELLSKYKNLQRYAGVFLQIGHLAFDLLLRENIQSLVFSKAVCKSYLGADEENDESINVCLALGILSKTETTTRGLKKMESYSFCHKTFQEFFAALWLASKYANEKSKLYKCIKNVDDLFDYEVLIIFLCGIDPRAGKQMWLDLAEDLDVDEIEMIEMEHVENETEMNQWTRMQTLVCKCMEQQEFKHIDQASDQIYFCIPHIELTSYTSDENKMLLSHVLQEYSCNVKSVRISNLNAEVQSLKLHGISPPALDLRKSIKLEKLRLENLSVEGLLLPVEGVRITYLMLNNVTMTHHDLEQLLRFLSSCSDLEELYLDAVRCNKQSHSCCIPVLDLQKHNKLKELKLENLSVGDLLLPVEGVRMTFELTNVTMAHHGLEQLSGSLSSFSDLWYLYLNAVRCREQSHSCCVPVLDLQKHNKLKTLILMNLYVEGLLLPVEGVRMIFLMLDNVTMAHQGLEQLSGSLSSCSDLEELYLDAVRCSEKSHSCCISVLDLQKHNKLKKLMLNNLSVKGLLLPVEGVRVTYLKLNNVTMAHHGLEQLSGSLSSCSDLLYLYLDAVKCNKESHSCCVPVLDLQKHNKLNKLWLENLSVGGLLLPVDEVRMTLLMVYNVTMIHHDLEQLSGFLSSCSDLEELFLDALRCNEQSHKCCIPVLDLQKHNKLKKLWLKNLSVEGLLLPVEGVRITYLKLNNVTMAHHNLEQLSGFLSSCSDLEELYLDAVTCSEHSHSCCISVLDLQKHKKLKKLILKNLSVKGLLLPVEGVRMTLELTNVTMAHQGLEQLSGFLSSCSDLEELFLDAVRCNEQSHSCCIPVLDLQKHNKLKKLVLKNLSVEGLLLPVEGVRMTLELTNVTMAHHNLEQLSGFLSSCSDLEELYLDAVTCSEQSHSCCISVLDLQKHKTLKKLILKNLSVEGLLLPVEGVRMTLELTNVTMAHQGLEQLSGSLSSCSDLLYLYLDAVRCNEQSHSCCIPVLDLQKHNKLKILELENLSVGGLLLPVKESDSHI